MLAETPIAVVGALGVRQCAWAEARGAVDGLRHVCFFGGGAGHRCDEILDDPLDRCARHIVVADSGAAVGACRLFIVETAAAMAQASSAAAYCVESLFERAPELRYAELSRFCVAPSARARPALEGLWRGLWRIMVDERIDVMFGTASLPGADFSRHAATLAWLCDPRQGDPRWRVKARSSMQPFPARPEPSGRPPRLPALLRGYRELGATFSPEATLDPAFDTTDVFVVQPVAALNQRYVAYFS